jgi:hypothetical protein
MDNRNQPTQARIPMPSRAPAATLTRLNVFPADGRLVVVPPDYGVDEDRKQCHSLHFGALRGPFFWSRC